jgi:mono/diheme cytochrome c family protein
MPRWLIYVIATLVVLSWVPLGLIAYKRATTTTKPRIHVIQDMDNQKKYKTQTENLIFADGRTMRRPVDGTVEAVVLEDPAVASGTDEAGDWLEVMPVDVTPELLARGRERYEIYCTPCHGYDGAGQGAVHQRALELEQPFWVPPSSMHTDTVRGRTDGHIYSTITNGLRNMNAYGAQVEVRNRWAIVAYVRALQRSQNATIDDVPADQRATLEGR